MREIPREGEPHNKNKGGSETGVGTPNDTRSPCGQDVKGNNIYNNDYKS